MPSSRAILLLVLITSSENLQFSFELLAVRFPEIAQASSSLLGCCNNHHLRTSNHWRVAAYINITEGGLIIKPGAAGVREPPRAKTTGTQYPQPPSCSKVKKLRYGRTAHITAAPKPPFCISIRIPKPCRLGTGYFYTDRMDDFQTLRGEGNATSIYMPIQFWQEETANHQQIKRNRMIY